MKSSLHAASFNHFLLLVLLGMSTSTVAIADQDKYEKCLLREMQNASGDMKLKDLKEACAAQKLGTDQPVSDALLEYEKKDKTVSALDERIERESQTALKPFVLTPH
ncbi:MAG: hypothetical protein WBM38_12735, partial [Arenicellales bacterium]